MSLNSKMLLTPTMSTPLAPLDTPKPSKATDLEVVQTVGAFRQIEAQAHAVGQQSNLLEKFTLELQDINRTLSGDLSNFSRGDVEAMAHRALVIESQLETLNNPDGVSPHGPGA